MPTPQAFADLPPTVRQSSPRSQLGRLALNTAQGLPQIAGGVAGAQKLWATEDEGEILAGVTVAARTDERFDVELHLVARWPFGSLFELAEQIRDRVGRAASRAGLEDILGDVAVAFEDVVEPGVDDDLLASADSGREP